MTLYVIDPDVYARTGVVNSTMSAPDDEVPTTVNYSGYLYNNKGNDLTLDEYKAKTGKHNLAALTWAELEPLNEAYKKSLQEPWKALTKERYNTLLNCLPPMRWRDLNSRFNVFCVPEAWTQDLHLHCVYDRASGIKPGY